VRHVARLAFASVIGLAIIAAPAATAFASSPQGTTDPVTTFTKTSDVRITMRDGISLDSDEYVPDHGCPCPVILVQTPYRKSDSAVGEYNPYFPSHGYAEIVVDVRGTGSSEGYWTSFGTPEQQDGVELVHWAAKRPFSNGKIGLAGVSYSAINQFLTAEQPGTEAVKAIFPIVPMGDSYRDVVFSGGNTDTGFIPLWLGLVNSLNMLPTDDAQTQPAIALNVESQHIIDVAQFSGPAVADATLGSYESSLPSPLQTFPDQAYDGPYYRTVSPLSHIDRVHVPTFIVGGEYDLFQRSEPLLWRGLGLPTTQKKLVFGPWYHGSPSTDLTADDGTSPVTDQQGHLMPSVNNLALSWFDHWLKGMNNDIEQFPTVETYQIGRNSWSANSSYPAAGTTYQPWYLGSSPSTSGAKALYDGTLAQAPATAPGSAQVPWQPATGACSRSTAQWTAGLAKIPQCETDNSYSEAFGASFTSTPFKKPYVVSGPILADLWLSSTRADTSIVATVTDVAPDGTSDRVTAGSLVASLRDFTATPCGAKVMDCSVYYGGVPAVPWHPYTHSSQSPLTTGTPVELKVEIFPTSLVLMPGHSLRVSITTGDLPHQGPNLSTLSNSTGGVDTIYFGPDHPSRVYLGDPAEAGAPASATSFSAPSPALGLPFTSAAARVVRVGGLTAALLVSGGAILLALGVVAIFRRQRS